MREYNIYPDTHNARSNHRSHPLGSESLLQHLQKSFPFKILSVSGNYCCDKKPSALNLIKGRGKSITLDCTIPEKTVKEVLKTTSGKMVKLNYYKNSIGSALAGTVGGNNAHAANVVAAFFLATGQVRDLV